MEPVDFIKQHEPFDRLTERELERLAAAVETVRFPAGARILEQGGEPSRCLFVIRTGAARLSRDGYVVQLLEEGEPFGESSLLSGRRHAFDIVAEEDTLAYCVPAQVFRELLQNRRFAGFFLEGLGERLRRTRRREQERVGDYLSTPVGSLVSQVPRFVEPGATVAHAARIMDEAETSSVLVSDEPVGILTDRDLRSRVLAGELGPDTLVRSVMSRPLTTTAAGTPTYGALLLMLEEGIHHLPVVEDGRIVGVVTDGDLLRHQAKGPFYLLRRVESLERRGALADYAEEITAMAGALFRSGLDATQIARVIASVNDALARRLISLAEEELGAAPGPYAWIVLGSEGRMEQVLLTDQDNGLVYADDTEEARLYFAALAEPVVEGLVRAGFPRCPGGYMATNWCRPRSGWVELLERWVGTPEPQALLAAEIFLDFRAVDGDLELDLLDDTVLSGAERGLFLPYLARAALSFRAPLRLFRRIRHERGEVDLKRGGIAAVASLARVYALEGGSRARSTLDRLEAAADAGTLSRDSAELLGETFRFLMRLRLREQLRAAAKGGEPSNRVRLADLSQLELRHLKEAFRAILELQRATALRFRLE
jgi:CBS domain-containing protein